MGSFITSHLPEATTQLLDEGLVSGPKTPLVSMATDVNTWEESRLEYFVFFRLSATAATIPGPRAASSM